METGRNRKVRAKEAEKPVSSPRRRKLPHAGMDPKKKRQFLAAACVAVSLALWGYLTWFQPDADPYLAAGQVERDGYGGTQKEQQLIVSGLGGKEQVVTVLVSPRVYTKEEADTVFYEAMEALGEEILGENESLDMVTENLVLPSYLRDRGVRVRWHSSEPEFLSSTGTIETEVLRKQEVILEAELQTGDFRAEFEIPVTLVPKARTGEEQMLRSFSEELARMDEQQKNSAYLELPAEYEGKKLSYRAAEKQNYGVIPLLGILTAALLFLREDSERKEQEKKREQKLLLDYAELVSKLQVLVGAGMTVRNAWGRMVRDYEAVPGKKERPAYEEMRVTYYQMENGTPEGTAFREFGRRCRLQPYLKLSSILEQNRKTGTKNLRELLRIEVTDAFEMRKNLARRMGEEAGTKLLAPLFLLLLIVMIFIMVPAMMTMG